MDLNSDVDNIKSIILKRVNEKILANYMLHLLLILLTCKGFYNEEGKAIRTMTIATGAKMLLL